MQKLPKILTRYLFALMTLYNYKDDSIMYLIDYITTDCEGCDAMDDDFTSAASDPIEAIQELKKQIEKTMNYRGIKRRLETNSEEEKTSPNAIVTFKKHYKFKFNSWI